MLRLVPAVALVALAFDPAPAHACSPIDNASLVLDPAYADDSVAPGAVTAAVEVSRSDDDSGCGTPCGRGDLIIVTPRAVDDRAPAARLGYQLRLVGGELPRELWIDSAPMLAHNGAGDELWLLFDDDDEGFAIQLEIRAVDLNGNVGPPTIVNVTEPGLAAGCAAAGAHGPAGVGLLAVAGLVAVRRRRPRPQGPAS